MTDTPGPLIVSAENPRYFTVGGTAVYLTGSHVWNNFQDGLGPGATCGASGDALEANDYAAYLAFLAEHGHNFIRLWRWEHFRSQSPGRDFHLCMTPQPWPRTGPGHAEDGKPRFDLSRFDPAYFERLRSRVSAAARHGIYVSVMLFDGWGLNLSPSPDNLLGHPFYAANNINGIAIGSGADYMTLPLTPAVRQVQEAYLRRVVDAVGDLPNVLFEVSNETPGVSAPTAELPGGVWLPGPFGDSTRWQYWVIGFVRDYERERGYGRHPIGMTMQVPVADQGQVNKPLLTGPADWISPGAHMGADWLTDPPPNDGSKVILTDTDHYAPGDGDALWAWKSFLRGHNPILMDYGIIDVVHPLDPSAGVPSYESLEAARYAMGDTLSYARRMRLLAMAPHSELSSTGYALASPGSEYLILQPTGSKFTITLAAGKYTAEWHSLASRDTMPVPAVTVAGDGPVAFSPPFTAGPAVLYLRRT